MQFNNFFRKMLPIAAAVAISSASFSSFAQSYQVFNVTQNAIIGSPGTPYGTLQAAVDACPAVDSCVITLTGNDNLNAVVTIDGNRNVTLTSTGSDTIFQQAAGSASYHILVKGTSILTLTNIILKGLNKTNGGVYANVNAANSKVYMKIGTVIQDCYNGLFIVNPGNLLYLYEGAVTNNRCGVQTGNSAVVRIIGGEIMYNEPAGGLYISTTSIHDVIMSGGVIRNNKSLSGDFAGGVTLRSGSRFTMRGTAVIRDNIVECHNNHQCAGGGVGMANGTWFYMYDDAVIERNRSVYTGHGNSSYPDGCGGGIFSHFDAYINIYGGTIRNNIADYDGGGIYQYSLIDPRFSETNYINIYGGKIEGNIAGRNGGGLWLRASDFLMEGGEIIGNTAAGKGGGIFSSSWIQGIGDGIGSCTISNSAIISGNAAGTDGGGMYIDSITPFTMTSGNFNNNTATNKGGGIFTEGYNQLNVGIDAVFSGNTADTAYWLEISTVGGYDPGTGELSYNDIKTLYPTKIATTSFSTPPCSTFTYLYNNYDVNLVGETKDCSIIMDTVCFTDSVTLAATVIDGGENPTYQWFRNGVAVDDSNDSIFKYKAVAGHKDTILCKVYPDVECPEDAYSQIMIVEMLDSLALEQPDNDEVCVGEKTKSVTFSGTYDYVRWEVTTGNGLTIGMPANSGTGDISAFTTTNSGIVTITATPVSGKCEGVSKTFTITVNPKQKIKATIKMR